MDFNQLLRHLGYYRIQDVPFYIKFPKECWPEIERAEKFTEEGELVFRELQKKYKEEFFDPVKTEPRFQQIG